MKPMILVVEDKEDILLNLKITLEFNEFNVTTARDGVEALENLSKLEKPPNLILSDIMMPRMNGYDFFEEVSKNPLWNSIPFIFLTAKTSPDEVRFGKMLGVDDYIKKPFKEEDLLASISGKLAKSEKVKSINKKIEEYYSALKLDFIPSIDEKEKKSIILLLVIWDDKVGPELKISYPHQIQLPVPLAKVGFQLFNSVSSIYGQSEIQEAEGILIDIKNIQKQGYIYFNAIPNLEIRGFEQPFMLGVITSQISYFESLKIKEVLQEISIEIKECRQWNIEKYWEQISNLLST